MSKIISPDKFDKRAKISRLAAWSLVVVTVFTIAALIFAFFVLSTSNPTNQSTQNTIMNTEESTSTEENASTNIAPATTLTSNNEPIKITPVFWGMLVIFLSLLFVGLRQLANRR